MRQSNNIMYPLACVLAMLLMAPPAIAQPMQDGMYVAQVTRQERDDNVIPARKGGSLLFVTFIIVIGGTIFWIRRVQARKKVEQSQHG